MVMLRFVTLRCIFIEITNSEASHIFEWLSDIIDENMFTSGNSLWMTENKLSSPFLAIQSILLSDSTVTAHAKAAASWYGWCWRGESGKDIESQKRAITELKGF